MRSIVAYLGILYIPGFKALHQSGVGGTRVAGPHAGGKDDMLEPVAAVKAGLVQERALDALVLVVGESDLEV